MSDDGLQYSLYNADARIEELEAENKRLGWQPIVTAPKDGQRLMLWLEDEGFWLVGFWRGEEWWLSEWGCSAVGNHITHWMRPEPPNVAQATTAIQVGVVMK